MKQLINGSIFHLRSAVDRLRHWLTLGLVKFVWSEAKNASNKRKHGVSFQEAKALFTSGVDYLEIFDDDHSIDEDRFLSIGPIARGLVLVVWTERDETTIRIIGARWATRPEQELYREHLEQHQ